MRSLVAPHSDVPRAAIGPPPEVGGECSGGHDRGERPSVAGGGPGGQPPAQFLLKPPYP
jgi:hypothetical protein